DRARKILPERLVAEVPRLLLAEAAELAMDLRGTDPLRGKGIRELLDGPDQLRGRWTDRLHERASGRRREVDTGLRCPLQEPGLEVLPLELYLLHGSRRLDELEERSRRLTPLGDRATQDEGGVRIRRAEVAAEL